MQRSDDGAARFEIAVKGARCANCIAKIEGAVRNIAGVTQARLNLSTGKLVVTWPSGHASAATILECVRALGYEAQPFDAGTQLADETGEGTALLRCLAVAGFGTVFVMGLTDAVWYGASDMSAGLRSTFFWLAASVSVPVTLYASRPFFRSALRSLARGHTNMDLPISLAILLSLGLSVYETFVRGAQTYFDAAVMLAFLLLIGRYLDFQLRNRARSAAQHLLAMQSVAARRIAADGHVETIAARDVLPGDLLVLSSGARLPADARLEDGETTLDISLVTGETEPVAVAPGAVLHAGTIIVGPPVMARATARADDFLVADLARLLEAGQQARSLYVRLADRAARAYVPFVSTMAVLVAVGWLLAGVSAGAALTHAIAVLIVTCPCALGLAVPAVQIVATGRLFDRGIFVKSGDALERLAEIDMAVFDKTGTLSWGRPALQNAAVIPKDILASAATLARASSHPLACALASAAGKGPVATGVIEVPGQGLESRAPGGVSRLGNAAWCGRTEPSQASELWFRDGDAQATCLVFRDTIRPDAAAMLQALIARGVAVEMLTGDRESPAAELAAQAGIDVWQAGVGPQDKAAHLAALRARGHRVLMVGDGLNDAGALALAHVSIAPGNAADVSQLAADMVLRGDSLMPIADALAVARKARRLVLENFAFAALYNAAAIPLAALGFVTPLMAAAAMAGSSLVVTLNALRLAGGRGA